MSESYPRVTSRTYGVVPKDEEPKAKPPPAPKAADDEITPVQEKPASAQPKPRKASTDE